MDSSILNIVGQIAGIGGLALGVLSIVFREIIRKTIFPMLKQQDAYRLLRLITSLTFLIALAGIAAWVLGNLQGSSAQQSSIKGDNNTVLQKMNK